MSFNACRVALEDFRTDYLTIDQSQYPTAIPFYEDQKTRILEACRTFSPAQIETLRTIPNWEYFDAILFPKPVEEPVAQTLPATITEVEEISAEEFFSQNLQSLRMTLPEAIKEKVAEYRALVINGVEDKESYKAVDEARKTLKKTRTGIEKKRKELKEPVLAYGKQIDSVAKELTALVEPVEIELDAKIKFIDDALKRAELEEAERQRALKRAELEAAQRKQSREADLFAIGMFFNGVSYFSPSVPNVPPITPDQLANLDDASWNQTVASAKTAMAPPPPPPVQAPAAVEPPVQNAGFGLPPTPTTAPAAPVAPAADNYFGIPTAGNAPVLPPAPAAIPPVPIPAPSNEPPFMAAENRLEEIESRPSDYERGFEDCKQLILGFLANPTPIQRIQIVEFINSLTPPPVNPVQ